VGDNFVCVKPCIFDLGGDISAPEERTGKVGESLAVCLVSARSVEPLGDWVVSVVIL
jgi:hypothetical protein